jgi:thioester reductase-like protein
VKRDLELAESLASPAPGGPGGGAILVTGAAGFLGARLLAELSLQGVPIYALVRAPSDAEAYARLRGALRRAGLGTAPGVRVEALAGDVAKQDLGLGDESYARLAAAVGRVYNCAAVVNAGLPYGAMRATNVEGALNLLRFCGQERCKRLHLMSSTVAGPGVAQVDPAGPMTDSYARTKAVAEAVCAGAAEKGFDVVVYRLGALGGDSRTGFCNERDWRWLVLKATLALGEAPLLASSFGWLPVDDAVRAIAVDARRRSPASRCLRLAAPRRVAWLEVFSWLRRYGYGRLRLTSVPLWQQRVAALDSAELAALAVTPIEEGRGSNRSEPAEVKGPGAPALRSLDQRLMTVYLDAAVGAGAVPAPGF